MGGQATGYDAVVSDAIQRVGSLTKAAVDARVHAVGDATYAPVWKASTAYSAGDRILSPLGAQLSRTASGTSRSTFDGAERALWTPVGATAELCVNVRDFGALPSTGTDYTTWVDVTSQFQAAINYAIANKIGKVFAPGGNYLVNGALTVNGPLRIEGSFMGRAKLTGMPADTAGTVISTTGGTAGSFVLTATPPGGATSTWGLSVADITFYGYGTGSPVDRGAIKLDHVWSELAFDNVKILGFQRQGLLTDNSQDGTFKNVTILSCGSHTSGSYAALDMVNNTNALHFFGLHIENSPYLLHLGAAAQPVHRLQVRAVLRPGGDHVEPDLRGQHVRERVHGMPLRAGQRQRRVLLHGRHDTTALHSCVRVEQSHDDHQRHVHGARSDAGGDNRTGCAVAEGGRLRSSAGHRVTVLARLRRCGQLPVHPVRQLRIQR
jgi:hypothetical protein